MSSLSAQLVPLWPGVISGNWCKIESGVGSRQKLGKGGESIGDPLFVLLEKVEVA